MAKADFLKQRAQGFLEIARARIEKKDYSLAAFSLEQTVQLYLKYYLFLKIGDFPRVHSLDELLRELGKAYEKHSKLEEFRKKKASVIGDLNQAYITSRYLPAEFNQYQVENMESFVEELIKFLEKTCQ